MPCWSTFVLFQELSSIFHLRQAPVTSKARCSQARWPLEGRMALRIVSGNSSAALIAYFSVLFCDGNGAFKRVCSFKIQNMMAGLGEANAASGIALCPWHWGAPPLRGKFGYAPDLAIDINWPSKDTCEGEQVKMICLVMCSSTYDHDSRLKITLSENIHIIQTEMIHAGTTLFWFALILRALLLLATSFRKLASYRDRVYMIIYVAVSHVAPSLRHGSAGRSSALGVMRSGWGWAFNCKEIMQSYINQPMSKMSWGFEMSWTRIRPGSRDIREVRKRQHFEWRKGRRSLLCAINIICCIIVSQNIIYLKTFCIITTFIYIYNVFLLYMILWNYNIISIYLRYVVVIYFLLCSITLKCVSFLLRSPTKLFLHGSYDPAPNSIQVTVSNQVLPRPTLEIFLDEDWPQHGSIPACQRSQVRPWCRKANALFQSLPNSTCTISIFFCVGGVRTHEAADSLPWNIPVPSLG